ncbi:MAG: hypothetical protein GY804_01125 [Alphaproteobacteria bacterium]|nr:hypothetical protein [Alphaproteobacteria bacterium]
MINPSSVQDRLVIKPLDVKSLNELYQDVMDKATDLPVGDEEAKKIFLEVDIVKELLYWCWEDTRAYASVFYPERFNLGFSSLHDEMWAVIDEVDEKKEPKNKRIAIKGFRGIGKSSSCRTLVAKRGRYQDAKFCAYIGKNEEFAINQTEMIKNSSQMNQVENFFFGMINPKYADLLGVDASFSKKGWIMANGMYVLPRGVGQPVRGQSHEWENKTYRLELGVLDDTEDPKYIDNETYRNNSYNYVLADVVEAKPLPGMSTNWQIIYIDTLKHEDAVLQRLFDRNDWTCLDLPLCDGNFKSYAPGFVSDEDIQKELEEHRNANPSTVDVFYQEKMGVPISLEDAAFKKEMFRYYDEQDKIAEKDGNFTKFREDKKAGKIQTVILGDPAKTVKMHSAESGFGVISFNVEDHRIYIRYADGLRVYPDEFYNHLFDLAIQYEANVIGYEETSLNEFIRKPIADAMLKRGLRFRLEPLKARSGSGEFSGPGGGKKARVASMISYYRRGEVYHNIKGCGRLEAQLMSFPKSKLWDIMDVVAYFPFILEKGFIYWVPPEEKMYTAEEAEKDYKELLMEDAMEDSLPENWRFM